jgi:hydroxymethylpyrimidine/phosphomethylpyrimidine kinase
MVERPPVILTIAGFDPSSGAGVTADLQTIAAHSCFGVSAITAMTVQNTQGVRRVEPQSPNLVRQTLFVLADDFDIAAVKVGMLGDAEVARAVAMFLEQLEPKNLVVDPIFQSSSGATLLDEGGQEVLTQRIFPLARVITPNANELGVLISAPVKTAEDAARGKWLLKTGAKNVVVTGGHLPDNADLLFTEKGEEVQIPGERIDSRNTHGTGCAFSTAIACNLAQGLEVELAVYRAKEFVREAIRTAPGLGKGKGPMNLRGSSQ